MSRRSLPLVLLVLAALVAANCGGGQQTTSPGSGQGPGGASPGAESPVPGGSPAGAELSGSLQVGAKYGCEPVPCTPSGEGAADEIARTRYDTFASQYPSVTLDFTESDFDPQSFLTAVAAGTPPDVIRLDRTLIGTYVAEGAIDPLDECISRFGIDMSQYREAAVAQVTIDGVVYGLPEFFDSRIVLINDSVVEAAGLTPEDVDTSDWERLAQVNEQLLAREGDRISRIGFDPKLPEFLPLWARANGASLLSDDGMTSQLDDPRVAEALEFAVSLIRAHGSAPAFFDFRMSGPGGSEFFGPQNQFAVDTVGAFPMEQWYLNVLANNSPEEGISFQPFRDRQGNPISLSGGAAWVIPSSARNKDAACEFMRVVTLPDTWYAAAKVRADQRAADGEAFTGVYTANTLADERIFGELVTEESAGRYYEGVQLVLEVSRTSFALPANPAAEQFTRIWQAAVQQVMNEGADPAQALAQADEEAQQAIDSAR